MKQKLVFVLGFPIPFPGAAWTRIGHLASYFAKRGHNIVVLSSVTHQNIMKVKKTKLNDVTILNVFPTIQLDEPVVICIDNLLSCIFSLMLIPFLNPNIVIFSVPPSYPALGASLVCKLFRKKVVFDYRDEWEDHLLSKAKSQMSRFFYRILKNIMTSLYRDSFFVVTETSAHEQKLKRRGIRSIYLIPNGADVTIFHPSTTNEKDKTRSEIGVSHSDFVIVYSGYIGGSYSLDVVINALATFMRSRKVRNVKLILMGEGRKIKDRDVEKILELAKRLRLSENVIYLGAVFNQRKVADITACADVGLIPYDDNPLWKNTLPAKFFEYCACGVPVVATAFKDSTLAELIEKHGVGLVAEPMNVKDLANALKKAYFGRELTQVAGQRARKLVETHFDRAKSADKLSKLLFRCNKNPIDESKNVS